MWGNLQSAIMLVSEIAWVGYIAMLLVFVKLYPQEKSGIIALAVWCITDLISTAGSPALYMAVAEGRVEYGMWFTSFVILNTLAIFTIVMLHRSYGLFYSRVAITVCAVLLLISAFHAVRLIDRMLLDIFPAVYRYGLMSLKFLVFYLVYLAARSTQRSVA